MKEKEKMANARRIKEVYNILLTGSSAKPLTVRGGICKYFNYTNIIGCKECDSREICKKFKKKYGND